MGRYDMKRRIYIGEWVVDFLFQVKGYRRKKVLNYLFDAEAPMDVLMQSEQIMESGFLNTGFTYSDAKLKRCIVVIGPSSSSKEFLNTLVHEIHHVAVAIASSLGVDLEEETPAYMAGNAMLELADLVCELGCSKCHDESYES